MLKVFSTNRGNDNVLEPQYLYHATYGKVMDSIREHGLDNRHGQLAWQDSKLGVVYLAYNPYEAESYAETSEDVPEDWLDDIIVLKVNICKLDKSRLHRDNNVIGGETTFEYHGVIPYDAVEIFIQ